MEWINLSPVPVNVCKMCFDLIMKNTGATLPCGEEYHEHCLIEYFSQLVEGNYSDREFKCPNYTCITRSINAYVAQQFMPASTWEKYQFNFRKEHTTPCPRCNNDVEDQDEHGGRKINLLCKKCSFNFCVACKETFNLDHDEKRCQFNQIQAMVGTLEGFARELGGFIGQCPNCKIPNLKGDGCDDITCTSAKCKTRFCVQCSTPAYLYEVHGASRHRPACPRYVQRDFKEGMNTAKCKACATKGALCTPPTNLLVRARFTFEES
jgi:hypothetical protein